MKSLTITAALLISLVSIPANAASNKSSRVRMNFEKTASAAAPIKSFSLRDHRFNISLSDRLNAGKDLANNPKPSKIEEKAVKILSFGFEI